MKVLLVNKFYYPRGGDCLVAMGIEKILREHGHEVAFFAMQYSQNIDSDWQSYFPCQVSFSGGEISDKVGAVKRLLGKDGVVRKFEALLDDFSPDVVHLHNVHSYLSPIVAEIAKSRGVRVMWTLHDYKLICPTYSFLREGKVCELCLTQPTAVLTKKCMKGSLPGSLIAYIEAQVWNRERLIRNTDVFICPSRFMKDKMIEGGFPEAKLTVLHNFLPLFGLKDTFDGQQQERETAYCYVGRLSDEKGIGQLLEVAACLPYQLFVAGTGPMENELRKQYTNHKNIIFLGQQSRTQVEVLLKKMAFSVIPSIWYENNPLSVIESLCLGTPVLGAEIGGIPELIEDGTNGLLFQAGNMDNLKEKISSFFHQIEKKGDFQSLEIATRALDYFSEAAYYEKLIAVYLQAKTA
ncbi:MAG: glycosyltransferase [Bacteroidetes bacterium]|nr:glycosyltransferase [Bacteroidota bacterium]